MKNVILAFSNPLFTNWMASVLNRNGYSVEHTCKTASEVIRVSDFCSSLVVVSGFQFPDMTAENLFSLLDWRLAMVTILLSHQRDLIDRDDMFFLPYPLSANELVDGIELMEMAAATRAMSGISFGGVGQRPKERTAEENLLILNAKKIFIEKYVMTESQAHRFLQKSSMDRGLRLLDVAMMVIDNSLVL
ncbi:MAG TPA: ANTAR domain-containing protein [Treponemataceae bacterium]|nr:ANTAR domain-containing protein [Treponemataceae bacterium]